MKNILFSFFIVLTAIILSSCATSTPKDSLSSQGPIHRAVLTSDDGAGIDYIVDADAVSIMQNMEAMIKKGLGEEGNATEKEIAKVYRDADKVTGVPDFHITKAKAEQHARVFKIKFLDALGGTLYKSFAQGNPPHPATSQPVSTSP